MAAGAGRHRNQPVGPLANCRMGMAVVDDVMQHDAAIGMHGGIDLGHGAERGDDDRHLVFDAEREVMLQSLVRHMDDLINGEGAAGLSGWAAAWRASSSVISASHSSSWLSGRAFSAGNAPTMPALHCASVSAGCEMMNSGEPMTGSLNLSLRIGGWAMVHRFH